MGADYRDGLVWRQVAHAGDRVRYRGLVQFWPAAASIRWVLVRDPTGERKPQSFLSTDLAVRPEQILQWFVSRWRMETTFQEVRTHLGVETQRQWSDLAILRTTPALLGLFSLITVWADRLVHTPIGIVTPRATAWYAKREPTFSDAIAAVRRAL